MEHPDWLSKAKVYAIPQGVIGEALIKDGRIEPMCGDPIELPPALDDAWERYKSKDVFKPTSYEQGVLQTRDGRVWLVEIACSRVGHDVSPAEITCGECGMWEGREVGSHRFKHELVREDAYPATVGYTIHVTVDDKISDLLDVYSNYAGLRFISEDGERFDILRSGA